MKGKDKVIKIIITIIIAIVSPILVNLIAVKDNVSLENIGITIIYAIITASLGILGALWGKDILRKLNSFERDIDSSDLETSKLLTSEDILDGISKEIRRFMYDWNRRLPWDTGYRRLIESNNIGLYFKRISEQAQRIQRQVKRLQDLKLNNTESIINDFSSVADRLVDLGLEVETTFQTIKLKKTALKKDPNVIEKILSEGDKLVQDFKIVLSQLEKLRKRL